VVYKEIIAHYVSLTGNTQDLNTLCSEMKSFYLHLLDTRAVIRVNAFKNSFAGSRTTNSDVFTGIRPLVQFTDKKKPSLRIEEYVKFMEKISR
jgi:hypothetical protein